MDGEKIIEIRDIYWSDLTFDEEEDEESGEKRMRVQGVVQEAEIVNQNKRKYPKAVLAEAMRAAKQKMASGRVFGEVDHPEWRGKLGDSSHLLRKLWWKDAESNKLMGEMLVFNTPQGEIIQEILRAGGRPGFSSRGKGQSKSTKIKGVGDVSVIQLGYRFDSIDFVIDPSVRNARVTKVIEQALEQNLDTEETPMKKELKDLTADELRKENPDALKEIIEEERKTIKKEVEKEAESTDEQKAITKLEGEKTACETRITDLEAEVTEKDAEIERHLATIESIVDLLRSGEYLKAESEGETEDEILAAAKLKVVELEREAEANKAALKTKEDKLAELEKEKAKDEAQAHLLVKTEKHPLKDVLRDKLKDCKTIEDVDEGLKTYTELITALEKENGEPKGKGKGEHETEEEVAEGDGIKERVKARAGIKSKKKEEK